MSKSVQRLTTTNEESERQPKMGQQDKLHFLKKEGGIVNIFYLEGDAQIKASTAPRNIIKYDVKHFSDEVLYTGYQDGAYRLFEGQEQGHSQQFKKYRIK